MLGIRNVGPAECAEDPKRAMVSERIILDPYTRRRSSPCCVADF